MNINTNTNIYELQSIKHENITPKFLKSNSKSVWSDMFKMVSQIVFQNNESYESKLIELLEKISKQLEYDEISYNNKEFNKISDCALHCPRNGSHINDQYKLRPAYILAELIYVKTGRISNLLHAKIHYSRLISRLSKAYVDEQLKEAAIKSEFKINRILHHQRKNWCELKKRTITKSVGKPTAMPVEISSLEELQPFFNYLENDGDITQEPHTEFKRGAVYPDGRMDLCKQVVGPTWISNLMNSLKNNTKIKHFLLGNNITNLEGGKAIYEFLTNEHKSNIKTWYLAGSDFNDEAIKYITEGLMHDNVCEALWLKRNPIYAEGMKYIGELLKTNKKIHILDLHNTAIGLNKQAYNDATGYYEKYMTDDGITYLCEGLKLNNTLRHLYLDANALTTNSAKILANYFDYKIINNDKGIHSLWIDMNKLDNEGVDILVNSLKNYTNLKRLNIGSNMITEVGMKSVCEAFKNHKNIMVLDLSLYKSTADMGTVPNNISNEGVDYICKLIEENKSLRYLNISMNNISAESMEKITTSLESNTKIWYFYYTQYGIEIPQKTVTKINKIIDRNRSLNPDIKFDDEHLRTLKHSKKINNIDSIYRNNMK